MDAPTYHHAGYVVLGDAVLPVAGYCWGFNTDIAHRLCKDKGLTADTLRAWNIPAPVGVTVSGPAFLAAHAASPPLFRSSLMDTDTAVSRMLGLGGPWFVKPNAGAQGDKVTKVGNETDMRAALEAIWSTYPQARVECAAPGVDHRVLVLDGRVRVIYARLPPFVAGDGRTTLQVLVQAAVAKGAVKTGKLVWEYLHSCGLCASTVPGEGAVVPLLPAANISTGGMAKRLDVHDWPPAIVDAASRAVRAVGARWAGVDVLWDGERAMVVEVNTSPDTSGGAECPQTAALLEPLIEELVRGSLNRAVAFRW